MRRSGILLGLSLFCLTVSARGSFAAYIDLTGVPGVDGAPGATGAPGQDGGAGGSGEDLNLDLPGSDFDNSVTGTGGAGGAGGVGGDGVPAGAASGNGGAGGSGGASTVHSAVEGAGVRWAESIANGGQGGVGGAAGTAAGGGLPGVAGVGGSGGAAAADSRITGSDDVNAQALAYGGAGGASTSAGGQGGAATAHAEAYSSSESGTASAHATQVGGAGGSSETAAAAGQSSVLENQVTGDSAGYLELSQYAGGGDGGTGPGSRGGDARSVLTFERNSGVYGLWLAAGAQGGTASSPDGSVGLAARGGDADVVVEGRDHLGHSLDLYGSASAGNATGPNSQGGTPTVSVHGVSTAGGDIRAHAEAYGGGGTNGGSVDLFNAVTGETIGFLYLSQYAGGGYGSERAGSASSRLERTGSSAYLSLTTSASGGGTLDNEPARPGVTDDAFGFAESIAHNTTGSASAEADAYGGGAPTYPYPTSSDGGDGEAHASATTDSYGQNAYSSANAYGGSLYGDGAHRGGDALATSTATALGDSAISTSGTASAYSIAYGGGAGSGDSQLLRSGRARAESTAYGAGTGQVVADAFASSQFDSDFQAVDLSPALARAIATGRDGEVVAHTIALGGIDSYAHATAHSLVGAVSTVDAHVTQITDHTPVTALGAHAAFRNTYLVGNADFWTEEGIDSLGYMNALPVEGEAQDWSVDNSTVAAALGSSNPLAVGLVRANDGVSADFSLELATGALGPGDVLSIGFVDVKVPDSGFAGVHVDLVLNGNLVQLDFGSAAETLDGLSDDLVSFNLPSPPDGPVSLEIHYLINMLQATPLGQIAFDSRFIVFVEHVPEPAEAVLLGVAVIAFALLSAHSRVSRPTHRS